MSASFTSKSSLGKFIIVAAILSIIILPTGNSFAQISNDVLINKDTGFSGIGRIVPDTYLVVQDWKNYSDKERAGKRFGIVKIDSAGKPSYTPVTALDLNNFDKPRDLESICVLSNSYDASTNLSSMLVLSAESGDYDNDPGDGQNDPQLGYIYQLEFTVDHNDLAASNGKVVANHILPPHALSSFGGEPNLKFDGGSFEGLACARNPRKKNRVFVLIGERGGARQQGLNMPKNFRGQLWSASLNLKKNKIGRWTKLKDGNRSHVYDPPGPSSNFWPDPLKKRDISSLYICGTAIWAVATEDEGDDGEFWSVIYHVADYAPGQKPPFALVNDRSLDQAIPGHKIEGLQGTLTASDKCSLVAVTDDENKGGSLLAFP